jgi:hypothetical protein
MWFFMRTEMQWACLVRTIVLNSARGKIFAARDFSVSVVAARTRFGTVNL